MIIDRRTKLRFRRVIRKRRRQVEDIGVVTEQSIDKHFFRRLIKLVEVRRFIFGWLGLLLILISAVTLQTHNLSSHYQELVPVGGGTYREGIVGTFTNANPLYAQNSVDSSVSRLVFSSLFKYDEQGKLVPDLAEGYTLDPTETTYTVKLKHGVHWQDGQPLTAKDVVFTYKSIQNPEVKSHLFASWKGVNVEAKGDDTVLFKLPNALSAFPHSLINGIVPEHILSTVPPSQMRSNSFNNETPVGTGPFQMQSVKSEDDNGQRISENIGFVAYRDYYLGRPKLDRFVIRTYREETPMLKDFKKNQIDGMAGLSSSNDQELAGSQIFNIPVTSEVMVFFKNNQETLKDPLVRKALTLAVDKKSVQASLPYPVLAVDEPLLRSHVGYDKKYAQLTGDTKQAESLLDQAGWKRDVNGGMRSKDGKKMTFKLIAGADGEFTAVSGVLQKQWHDLGIDVQVALQSDEELKSSVSSHNYDALLYSIAVGSDPDVFPYWHSTQADIRSDTRLNLSEYRSVTADKALEAGRTRSEPQIRTIKYRPFLDAWQKDAPALALYQSQFFYVTSGVLHGFDPKISILATDRYTHVEHWTVRQQLQNR